MEVVFEKFSVKGGTSNNDFKALPYFLKLLHQPQDHINAYRSLMGLIDDQTTVFAEAAVRCELV